MRRRRLLSIGPAAALLAACSSGPRTPGAAPVEDPTPRPVGERAPLVPYDDVRLSLEMTPMLVVDPGWDEAPQQLDGVFLGYRTTEEHLVHVAVDQDGTVLWEADRPLSCTGTALTRGPGGRPIAVLADLAPRAGAIAASSLTAYDLRTAARVWGPVDVPGPQVEIGLVHAAPTDEPMGDTGPRSALDPATGRTALHESDLGGARIIGEHLGRILVVDDGALRALDAAGEQDWSCELPRAWERDRVRIVGDVDTVRPLAVVADGQEPGIVVDLEDGAVIAQEARAAAHDHITEIAIIAAGRRVRGIDGDGHEAWAHEDPEELDLASAGERFVYAVRKDAGSLVVLDSAEGRMVQPFDADSTAQLAMPVLFSQDSAAAVRAGERVLLVTTEIDEEYGLREG